MPDFSLRSNQIEIMDDFDVHGDEIIKTLNELEVINKWLGGNAVTIDGLSKLTHQTDGQLTIADLGCGGGDMLIRIADWAKAKNKKVQLIGFDANPHIVEIAINKCKNYPNISIECEDIFSDKFKNREFDIITSTLFTHHFDSQDLSQCYKQWYDQSRIGIVINDLHRHWFAYYSIKYLTALLSNSDMVKNDAPLSVARSFIKKDLLEIIENSLNINPTIKWKWAFRWQIVISKKS